ncbi:MAG: hypothetical protein QUT30_04505, partial [Acidobacteriota bacterium]|nr:hypothetical protein [Acidobacteriota bacterium]
RCLVGSEMCIRDSVGSEMCIRDRKINLMRQVKFVDDHDWLQAAFESRNQKTVDQARFEGRLSDRADDYHLIDVGRDDLLVILQTALGSRKLAAPRLNLRDNSVRFVLFGLAGGIRIAQQLNLYLVADHHRRKPRSRPRFEALPHCALQYG